MNEKHISSASSVGMLLVGGKYMNKISLCTSLISFPGSFPEAAGFISFTNLIKSPWGSIRIIVATGA